MKDLDLIKFLLTLKNTDWNIPINSSWFLRDVISHLIGWTEIDIISLEKIDELDMLPWRKKNFSIEKYNQKSIDKYSKIKSFKLIYIWSELIYKRNKLIEIIGIKNIRKDKDLSYYLFDGGNLKHNKHHYNQIKKAIKAE